MKSMDPMIESYIDPALHFYSLTIYFFLPYHVGFVARPPIMYKHSESDRNNILSGGGGRQNNPL